MSSNMVVMTFSNEHTAEQVRDRLVELQKANLIKLDDAVVVVRGHWSDYRFDEGLRHR